MAYQWTTPRAAGITMGVLLLLTAIVFSIILIRRHQVRKASTKSDPEIAAPSLESEPETGGRPAYSVPGPVHGPGTIRLATGQSETFYDWVRSDNAHVPHEHLSSLKNGPVASEASSMYSRPTISRANTLAGKGTRDSVDASSFRKAVMGAGETKGVESMEIERIPHVLGNIEIETKEEEKESAKETMKRGYSGAWP